MIYLLIILSTTVMGKTAEFQEFGSYAQCQIAAAQKVAGNARTVTFCLPRRSVCWRVEPPIVGGRRQ